MRANWKFVGACVDGERFEIDGVNVWDCKWVRNPAKAASVRDPHYNQAHEFNVYDLILGQHSVRVAAGEFSNCIWGFYVPVQA